MFILAPPAPETEALERNAIDAAVAASVKRIVHLSKFAATEGDADWFVHIHGLHQRLIATLGASSDAGVCVGDLRARLEQLEILAIRSGREA